MKRKFKISKILLSVWCLFAVLLGTACAEPPAEDAWKHQVTNTEILESDSFLDAPDSVVYYDKDFAEVRELSKEEGTRLKSAFYVGAHEIRQVRSRFEGDPMEEVKAQLALYGGIEFRYDQRRTYTGKSLEYCDLQNNVLTWHPGFGNPYDAVLVVPNGVRSFWIVFYLDGEYQKDFTWEMHYTSATYTRFCAAWQEVLGENVDAREPAPRVKVRDGAEYVLSANNTSIGIRMYVREIDGVSTEDCFTEFYDQDDVLTKESKSEYTLTPEDEAAARALLERFGEQMDRVGRRYQFAHLDGVMTLFETYEEELEDDRVKSITMRFDPETGEKVLHHEEVCL